MTNYNDGKWHDADGLAEWPVHCQSMVERTWLLRDKEVGSRVDFGAVVTLDWASEYGKTTSFRVVREHREPREWWIHLGVMGRPRISEAEPDRPHTYIHVREVL